MARVVRSNPRFMHARIGNSRRGILGGGVVATHVRGGELVYDRHGDECVRARRACAREGERGGRKSSEERGERGTRTARSSVGEDRAVVIRRADGDGRECESGTAGDKDKDKDKHEDKHKHKHRAGDSEDRLARTAGVIGDLGRAEDGDGGESGKRPRSLALAGSDSDSDSESAKTALVGERACAGGGHGRGWRRTRP